MRELLDLLVSLLKGDDGLGEHPAENRRVVGKRFRIGIPHLLLLNRETPSGIFKMRPSEARFFGNVTRPRQRRAGGGRRAESRRAAYAVAAPSPRNSLHLTEGTGRRRSRGACARARSRCGPSTRLSP